MEYKTARSYNKLFHQPRKHPMIVSWNCLNRKNALRSQGAFSVIIVLYRRGLWHSKITQAQIDRAFAICE